MREAEELKGARKASAGAANQMVTVSPSNLTFGYGRHACPGRFFAANEIKMIVGRALLNYDIALPEGAKERYQNIVFAEHVSPWTPLPRSRPIFPQAQIHRQQLTLCLVYAGPVEGADVQESCRIDGSRQDLLFYLTARYPRLQRSRSTISGKYTRSKTSNSHLNKQSKCLFCRWSPQYIGTILTVFSISQAPVLRKRDVAFMYAVRPGDSIQLTALNLLLLSSMAHSPAHPDSSSASRSRRRGATTRKVFDIERKIVGARLPPCGHHHW